MKKEALRVSTTIPAAPTTLYLAWLSSEQHAAMTGSAAKIDGSVGGKFTAQGGYLSGKLVTLDLGRRIIMSWRTGDFPREAPDSRVEIHFEALGGSTRLTILHTDIPEGQAEKYKSTWNDGYFGPMRTFFSKYLPDPRKPLPPRRPQPPPEEEPPESEDRGSKKTRAAKAQAVGAKPASLKPAAGKASAALANPSRPIKPGSKPMAPPTRSSSPKARPPAPPARPAAKAASKKAGDSKKSGARKVQRKKKK